MLQPGIVITLWSCCIVFGGTLQRMLRNGCPLVHYAAMLDKTLL